MSSSSEAKDLPALTRNQRPPNPSHRTPMGFPRWGTHHIVVPSIVSPHSDAGPVSTVGRGGGYAGHVQPPIRQATPHFLHLARPNQDHSDSDLDSASCRAIGYG